MADTYVAIPDLLYRGQQVYTLEASTAPSPSPTPTPTPAPVPTIQSTYQIGAVTLQDAMYLYAMTPPYRYALRMLPGSHQLFFDVLTNAQGKTYWELIGPGGVETAASQALKLRINQWINTAAYAPEYGSFKAANYTGPLVQIYKNLVAVKLSGK